MKKDKFLSAIGGLDEKYIAEYEKAKALRRRNRILRFTAVAASVCLVIGATAVTLPPLNRTQNIADAATESGQAGWAGAPTTDTSVQEPITTGQPDPAEPTGPAEPTEPTGPFTMLSITPEKTNGDYVACDSDFIVEAENATEELVREHIYISGGPEYTVTEEEEGIYRVSIQGSLSAGDVVSLSYANAGVTEYSWAFETERKLEVVSTSPFKGSSNVSYDSPISLELSMAGGDSIEGYVTFSPEISGRWEHLGTVHRFIPNSTLQEDTVYTVTVAPGYTVGEYTMDSYTFRFNTGESTLSVGPSPNYGGMLYFKPGEDTLLRRQISYNRTEGESTVRLYTFASHEAMADYLNGDESILDTPYTEPPFTASSAGEHRMDYNIGHLDAGYYLAEIVTGGASTVTVRSPICVNNVAAYAAVTERDLVVWTDDKDIRVSYNGHTAYTNENGIAHLRDVTDGSGDAGFVYLGDEQMPLVFAAPSYEHENYPNCYLYCDKPLYKTDDTVSFFGVVPTDLFYDGGKGAFTVDFYGNSGNKPVRTLSVTPDENGCFSGEISFTDLSEGYAYIQLKYETELLCSRSFDIEDYYLQNYIYDISCDKKYVTVGSTLDFSVSVSHISGVKVTGKRLCAEADGERYYAATDENGTAYFSIPGPTDPVDIYGSGESQLSGEMISLYGGDPEEGDSAYDSVSYIYYWIVREDADISYKTDYDGDFSAGDIVYKGVYLRPEQTDSTEYVDREDFYEYGAPFDGTVEITLTAERRERKEVTVDPDTGKTNITYTDITSVTETVETLTVKDVSEFVLRRSDYALPESDELTRYTLKARYYFRLGEGNTDTGDVYLKSNSFVQVNSDNSTPSHNNVGIYSSSSNLDGFNTQEYGVYRYVIKGKDTSVRTGEEVPLYLFDTVKQEKVTDGCVLRIIYRNGVIATDLVEAKDAAFTYLEEYGPYVNVTYAYHLNGRFYRLPACRVLQDTAQRTVTLTQTTDKDSYAPGDTVTLTLKATDETGAGVPCTLNVSVVNEAVFAERTHSTDILSILTNNGRSFPLYSFSTYYDRELYIHAGGMGDGGGHDPRINFADTALFTTVKTDEKGEATVTFTLPDSVTEYRITTHAASGKMLYGVSESKFKVNMDFFLSATAPRGQKHTDDFVAYATTVGKGTEEVSFTFSLKETGQVIETAAPVGAAAAANFGKLAVGTYTLCISAACGEYTDAAEYPIEVTAGSMTNAFSRLLLPDTPVTVTPSSFPAKIEIYTENTERYLDYFSHLSSSPRTRLDNAVCAYAADKLYNKLMGTSLAESCYSISPDFITDDLNLCSMYSGGGNDYILTALISYFTPNFRRHHYSLPSDSPDMYIRNQLLYSAEGKTAVSELKALEHYGDGDEQLRAVIGVAYAFLGDYDNAARLYATLPDTSDINGADALRALLATFVDRDNAASVIDRLMTEEPNEYYLNFAVLSFMQNRIGISDAECSVTLTVNGRTAEYTASDLKIETLYIENDGSGTVTASYSAEGNARVKLTYTAYGQTEGGGDFFVWLEGDLTKNGTVYLVLDAGGYPGDKSITVALPPSLRMCGSLSEEGVSGYAKHEHVSIFAQKTHSGTVRIPLLITQTGNYQIEPIRLTTEGGNHYYSNEIVFHIG